jgi:hypothetical protein
MTDEYALYRAHRFQITKREDGEFALFDPSGEFIVKGSLRSFEPLIMTGPEHYETCAESWCSKPKASTSAAGKSLLTQLGLTLPPQPTQIIKRRI